MLVPLAMLSTITSSVEEISADEEAWKFRVYGSFSTIEDVFADTTNIPISSLWSLQAMVPT